MYNIIRNGTDVPNDRSTPPTIAEERMLKMERTYVYNFIFKIVALLGVIGVVAVAGLSDGDALSTAEVFVYGCGAFLAACIGVWGASNCTRAIEAEKRRIKREKARLRRAAAARTAA